jgi:hypothetical protein
VQKIPIFSLLSSLGITNSIFEHFGLLNIQLPFIVILDAASPILYFQFLMSSSRLFFGLLSGHVNIGFHFYTFFTVLSSGIQCKWSSQLNLCAFMDFFTYNIHFTTHLAAP